MKIETEEIHEKPYCVFCEKRIRNDLEGGAINIIRKKGALIISYMFHIKCFERAIANFNDYQKR